MRRYLIALSLALTACTALADTTAVYEGPNSFKIEIADNGDLRCDVAGKPGEYVLIRGGEGFVVLPTPNGLVVDRISDIVAAMSNVMKEKKLDLQKKTPPIEQGGSLLIKGGVVNINGRSGSAYYFRPLSDALGPPVFVVSQDLSLAQLGAGMVRQNEISARLDVGMAGGEPPFAAEVDSILKSGTPLALGPRQLTTVTSEPIPSSRFVLPGPPETRAAIQARLEVTSTNHFKGAF